MECNQDGSTAQNSSQTGPEADPWAPHQGPDEPDSYDEELEAEYNEHKQEFVTLDLLFDFPEPLAKSIPSD